MIVNGKCTSYLAEKLEFPVEIEKVTLKDLRHNSKRKVLQPTQVFDIETMFLSEFRIGAKQFVHQDSNHCWQA